MRGCEGARVRRCEGAKVRGCEGGGGAKVRRCEGAKVRRCGGLPRRSREAAEAGGAQSGEPSAFLISPRRRSRKRRSGSCCASDSARAYELTRVDSTPKAAAQVGARRVRQVVVLELAARQDAVDQREARRRTVAHRDGHRAIQLDDRRRVRARQHVVQARRSAPSRSRPRRRPPRAPPQSPPAACTGRSGATRARVRRASLPRRSVSRFHSERSCSSSSTSSPAGDARAARRDSCSSIRASRPTASGSGSSSTSSRPRRIASPDKSCRVTCRARRGGIALVEHQVDDVKHRVETIRQLGVRRHLVGNARGADLGLGADDPLGQGRWAGQERARNLLGREPADLAQRQRQLRVRRQRRVAAGENQPQPIVFDVVLELTRRDRSRPPDVRRARPATRRTGRAAECRRSP